MTSTIAPGKTRSENGMRRPGAVVTGGCGDIGRGVAARLVADGFDVLLADIVDDAVGQECAREVSAEKGRTRYLRTDVRDADSAAAAIAALDRFDLLVSCAGIGRSAPVLDLSLEQWQAHLDVNLTGTFVPAQAAARRLRDEGTAGHLVFLSSWIGQVPWPEMTAYSVSKAGVEMLAKQFARELAPARIRCNVVAPGIVLAGMARQQLETEPQYAARTARVVPLGELQTVADVAAAVSFLASPEASYMTGSVLTVDGGCSLFAFD